MTPRSAGWLVLVLAGCGATQSPHATPPARPTLVVAVVYDQLASWVLETHVERLDPEGALRRTMARGQYVHRVSYAYGATFTAPGHASIYSGAPPFESGIPGNRVYEREARLSALDDGVHAIHGRTGAYASPSRLIAETVSDVLERETEGTAVTVALGMKDRSAVIPGGQRPDACLWFDARAGGFTTSAYYAPALPTWLDAWQGAHPFGERMVPWTPEDPASLASLGPDDRTGEGSYGWGSTFPHDPAGQEDPDAFLAAPSSTELLLELAAESVRVMDLGDDDVPDLLALSIANTDYVGHGYGPESWEYVDALVRADRALGRFLAALEREHTIAVLLTADHGIAPLVERSQERGHADAVRWTSEAELALLRTHLETSLGAGTWVQAWVQPYVYLAPSVRDEADRARVVSAIVDFLSHRPGIARVIDVRQAAQLRASDDPFERTIGRGITADPPGELYVVPSEWSVAQEDMPADAGTSHGSPWSYDREVPVIFAGPGIGRGESDAHDLSQASVAPTLARLLGVPAPAHATAAPLPGAPSEVFQRP